MTAYSEDFIASWLNDNINPEAFGADESAIMVASNTSALLNACKEHGVAGLADLKIDDVEQLVCAKMRECSMRDFNRRVREG